MSPLISAIGTILGYFICYGTIQLDSDWQWRIPCLVEAVAAGLQVILLMVGQLSADCLH
jgi:hypothetical protein